MRNYYDKNNTNAKTQRPRLNKKTRTVVFFVIAVQYHFQISDWLEIIFGDTNTRRIRSVDGTVVIIIIIICMLLSRGKGGGAEEEKKPTLCHHCGLR
jgi:hypothetical protein